MSILEALGVKEFPAPDSLNKLLNDHLVCQRAQALMVEHFAAEAIRQMHPLERQTLLKRISPPAPVEKPTFLVQWAVQNDLDGKPFLRGLCGRCAQDCRFSGTVEAAKKIVWSHCSLGPSKPSEEVLADYASRFVRL